nr:DUF917 family protein [Burkholderiaceae bacterium]
MSLDGARALGRDDVEAALIGGVLLSAGGSGRARVVRDRAFATQALERGEVRLTPIADLPDDARVLIATAVGAPGSGKHLANAEHSISAARRLLDVAGQAADGVMPGHVPGIYGWLQAAALNVPLLDAACNV